MKKVSVAAALAALSRIALASGDTGTGAVGEMSISGGQFAMMIGALVGLGAIIWVVAKVANK